jgi:hypothetical protein
MMKEPSVWDFLVAKIQFWKKSEIDFAPYLRDERNISLSQTDTTDLAQQMDAIEDNLLEDLAASTEQVVVSDQAPESEISGVTISAKQKGFPWRLLSGLFVILFGQIFMEIGTGALNPFVKLFTPDRPDIPQNPFAAILFYAIAAGLLVWSFFDGELKVVRKGTLAARDTVLKPVKTTFLFLSIPFLLSALVLMGYNRFTLVNVLCWVIGVVFFILAIWVDPEDAGEKLWSKLRRGFSTEQFHISVRWWDLLLVLVAVIALFFRLYLLDSVPAEMFSDQAEKLLDVQDVLDGQYSIFFPRNTGREAFQMYLSALVAQFVGIQFLTLKIGTALCGLLMLPYIYLLGKEIGNKQVGLYAVFFASIAYWPNVIARVGLRYILYAAFAAPTLYYLYRGLKRQHRNDFIMAGIFLGIGLHGYSSFRFIPIVVVVVAFIYLLHHLKEQGKIKEAIFAVLIIGLVSMVIFLPLMRYWAQNPESFSYRMATRLGTAEQDYPDEGPVAVFFKNTWRALMMFFDDNGEVWVHSVTHRPALDLVTAGFYFVGGLVMFLDYYKKRSWEYLSLVVSIPLLLMPSILSLAFPAENPCLNRTSAAMIPVFVIGGFGMDTIMKSIGSKFNSKAGASFVTILIVVLMLASAGLNFDLVFNQYADQFVKGAWNTSDIGQVIHDYAQTFGSYDSAYVIPFPHWVDTRLVGINAGAPRMDFALDQQYLPDTLTQEGSKLFIFKYDDMATLEQLSALYPEGKLKFYDDQYEGKDFYIFLVP